MKLVTDGLQFPEGPVITADGSILLVEIRRGTLTRVLSGGRHEIVARLGGGPNGAAIGPDGAVYVCNDGGLDFVAIGPVSVPTFQPADYVTGSIQRVVGSSFSSLYSQCNEQHLRSPDDLIFDASGHFWFTDWGKTRPTDRDITAVYYAAPDGSKITCALPGRQAPNGIALSPDDSRLYVAETYARWILYWELSAPGVIKPNPKTLDGSYMLTASIPGQGTLDSMAVDEEGNVYAATMLPQGPRPDVPGGITVVSPKGEILEFIELLVEGQAEPLPSNLCFGGPGRKTAFITLAGTGRLVSCEMKIPGKPLHFNR